MAWTTSCSRSRQMVEAEEVSTDGLTWTFRLRPGLKFHDGEPVLAKDVVASLARWPARDNMGLMLKAIQNELAAVDDRTFRWALKKPFRKMLVALGKIGTPCCFIMPERIAATDPFKQINEYVGSGPMKLRPRRMGSGRQGGVREVRRLRAPSRAGLWLAGGKRMLRRPHRMDRDARPGHRLGRAAERRGRLVGEPDRRPRPAARSATATSSSISPIRSAISAASA